MLLQWPTANEVLVLEDLVYLGRQSTFVFANPYLISGENERKGKVCRISPALKSSKARSLSFLS